MWRARLQPVARWVRGFTASPRRSWALVLALSGLNVALPRYEVNLVHSLRRSSPRSLVAAGDIVPDLSSRAPALWRQVTSNRSGSYTLLLFHNRVVADSSWQQAFSRIVRRRPQKSIVSVVLSAQDSIVGSYEVTKERVTVWYDSELVVHKLFGVSPQGNASIVVDNRHGRVEFAYPYLLQPYAIREIMTFWGEKQ